MNAKIVGKGKGTRIVPFPSHKFDIIGVTINAKTRDVVLEYRSKSNKKVA